LNKDTERLLKDIVGELSFRSITRREKDRMIAMIHEELGKEGFCSKLFKAIGLKG